MAGYFDRIRAEIDGAHAAHAEMLERVPDGLRASLPVDATGVTRAIEILGAAVGIEAELRAERDRSNRANPAVLHGRVFGRVPLAPETVVAAFADGARVRAGLLERLAEAVDGDALRDEVRALLAERPPPGENDADPVTALRAAYAAQEHAVLLCAGRLDARGRGFATWPTAIEPSDVMAAQRLPGLAPAIPAFADDVPLRDDAVDAAMAVLTVHHWDEGLRDGVRELGARAATSGFARMPPEVVERVVRDVARDLGDGTWDRRRGRLRERSELDVGLRLVVARP